MPFKSRVDKYSNRMTFKKGHIRNIESIEKQRQTMKKQYSLGIRKHPIKLKGIKDKYAKMKCSICNDDFIPTSGRQKWCMNCIPDSFSRRIYQRYHLNKKQYLDLMDDSGLCPICKKRKAMVVDHCHKTNKVRGIICSHCNISLNLIENKEILERAIIYLKE